MLCRASVILHIPFPSVHYSIIILGIRPRPLKTNPKVSRSKEKLESKGQRRLQNGAKAPIRSNLLPLPALWITINSCLAMSESEANKERFVHRLLSIRHALKGHLLVVYLLVLSHVGLVAEVVKVSGIGLRVEFWHEWSALGAESGPVNFGEVVVVVDFLDRGKALTLGGNETRVMLVKPNRRSHFVLKAYLQMKLQVRLLMK